MSGVFEWIIFLSLSTIAVVTAAGMLLTMSMYRAGLALMASFVALAGLFILLNADLLAAIQIMMNVGGMLVMVLFMVMMMIDPGGEMMWGMKRDMHMPGLAAFSMHMPRGKPPEEESTQEQPGTHQVNDWTCPMHPEVQQDQPGNCPKCGMTLRSTDDTSQSHATGEHAGMSMEQGAHTMSGMSMEQSGDGHRSHDMSMPIQASGESGHDMNISQHDMNMFGMTPRQYYQMMVDMAMSTSQLPWAIALGIASALLLIVLVVQTPWPLSSVGPTQDATNAVGELLLSRYMIGFEGAAFLILAGIAGAVLLAKRERVPVPKVQQAKQTESGQTHQQVYTCPMHPEVRQNQPGSCP